MAIDIDCLADWAAAHIDELPTEALFRSQLINVRLGEAPMSRTFLIAGPQPTQGMEALMKREDADPAPTPGESLTISDLSYRIDSVTAVPQVPDPACYRLTISRRI